MNIRRTLTVSMATAIFAAFAGVTFAETISINFVGGREGEYIAPMDPSEVAGMDYVADDHWNNAVGRHSGTLYDLMDGSGASTGASAQWQSGFGAWSLDNLADNPGNDRMMRGYLEADDTRGSFVALSNLPFSYFDVYVYFDGDNRGDWRKAEFTIGNKFDEGEDSEGTDFHVGGQNPHGLFQFPVPGPGGNQPYITYPNNDEGNTILLSEISGNSFTLTAFAGEYSGVYPRAPLNGMQIVPIPEPGTLVLLSMGAVGLLACAWRRRRGSLTSLASFGYPTATTSLTPEPRTTRDSSIC